MRESSAFLEDSHIEWAIDASSCSATSCLCSWKETSNLSGYKQEIQKPEVKLYIHKSVSLWIFKLHL